MYRKSNRRKKASMPGQLPAELKWEDAEPNSLASFPYLTVHGDCVRAVQPNSDDSPSIAWKQDAKLCQKIRDAVAKSPTPHHLPRNS